MQRHGHDRRQNSVSRGSTCARNGPDGCCSVPHALELENMNQLAQHPFVGSEGNNLRRSRLGPSGTARTTVLIQRRSVYERRAAADAEELGVKYLRRFEASGAYRNSRDFVRGSSQTRHHRGRGGQQTADYLVRRRVDRASARSDWDPLSQLEGQLPGIPAGRVVTGNGLLEKTHLRL